MKVSRPKAHGYKKQLDNRLRAGGHAGPFLFQGGVRASLADKSLRLAFEM